MQKHIHCVRQLRLGLCVLALGVFIISIAQQVWAQSTQGSIVGTVKDQSGSLVADALVTLRNDAEGTTRVTHTGSSGNYKFLDVKAGQYSIEIRAPRFQMWSVAGVSLAVRQELRVDASLAVGTVQQVVQVNANSVSDIQTDTPTVSGTLNSSDTETLPVNTRASFTGTSASAILGTLPGVQDDSSGISVQGALPFQVEVSVDGVSVKSATGGYFIGDSFPSTESISEIRDDGVLANAEFGDPGQVVVTTKGGTNQFHGTGFWYYQNSAFDAIPYTYPTTTTKASETGNTFGASVGGPVMLPHYNGHKRTFFFGAYEGWRHPAQRTLLEVVPSTLMKQGDFSKYVEPGQNGGNSFTGLRDPYTGGSYGTSLPSGAMSQIAQNVLKQFYPDPNVGDPTTYVDNGIANFQENVDASGHSNQFDARVDQYFGANQKFLLWGRFTWKNFPTSSPELLKVPSALYTDQNRVLRVDTNWTITPNLINEGGFGFTRYTSGQTDSFNGNAWTTAQGWQGLQNLFYNGIPEMDFYNIQSLNADRLTGLTKSFTYEYTDSLIWSKGNHTVKVGLDIQSLEAITPLGFSGADNYGTYTFNPSGNSVGMFTGVDFADFLMGLPNQTFYDVVQQDNDGMSQHYNFYAQDEWRINDRLQLSYGVRYELHPGYHDRFGDIGNFDPSVPLSGRLVYPQGKEKLLAQGYLASANACDPDGITNTNSAKINGAPCMQVEGNSTAGFPSGLREYPKLRFMPRFGFAIRPFANDKWAIRGGYGIYDINMLGSSFYSLTGTLQAYTQNFTNTYDSTSHAIGYQWPKIDQGAGGNGCTTCYGTDYFGTANDPNWKDPYTEQWAMSVDHDFGNGFAGRISYIGSETHQLVWAPDENTLPFSSTVSAYNQPFSARRFPNWGTVNNRATGANESYNSLQLEADHRLQQGLEYHSTFTWAKNLADNQGPAGTGFAGEGGGSRSTSVLDRHADFGNVYGTRRLRWNTTMLYDLPIGRGRMFGRNISRAGDLVVGGWRMSSILTLQTGPYETPYFPGGEGDPSGTGVGLGSSLAGWSPPGRNQHPDPVGGVSPIPHGRNRLNWTNAAAFTCPGYPGWTPGNPCTTGAGFRADGTAIGPVPLPIGRFGNSQVGSIEGPGLINLSAGLSKTFAVTERVKVRAEGTFTNVLNHTNLGDPHMNLDSPSFGLISNSIGSDFGGARTGQIAVRAEF